MTLTRDELNIKIFDYGNAMAGLAHSGEKELYEWEWQNKAMTYRENILADFDRLTAEIDFYRTHHEALRADVSNQTSELDELRAQLHARERDFVAQQQVLADLTAENNHLLVMLNKSITARDLIKEYADWAKVELEKERVVKTNLFVALIKIANSEGEIEHIKLVAQAAIRAADTSSPPSAGVLDG